MKKSLLVILTLLCLVSLAQAQHVAVKTNLVYGAVAQTPNLGLEVGLGNRSTLDVSGGYNWFNLDGSMENNKKLVHWLGQIEYRYWLCRTFNGHFLGVHALGSQFNISNHELPMLFGRGSEHYRHEGWAVGGGISYGYSFYLADRWSLELNVGVGYARLNYDKYDCVKCGKKLGTETRDYFGPTKAGVSLIFIIK